MLKKIKDSSGIEYLAIKVEKSNKHIFMVQFLNARNSNKESNSHGHFRVNNAGKFVMSYVNSKVGIIEIPLGSYLGTIINPNDDYDYFEISEKDYVDYYTLIKELSLEETLEEFDNLSKFCKYGNYKHMD